MKVRDQRIDHAKPEPGTDEQIRFTFAGSERTG